MSSVKYRRDIDGLRTLAVLPVVLFHAQLGPFTGGYVGVDIFFVISGFLISSILLGEIEAGDYSIARFYERRVRRIVPALTFLLAFTIVAAVLIYPPYELREFGKRLVASALFVANFEFFSVSNYFGPRAEDLELLHLWSLAVEEQFYLFFPPLLLLLSRWRQGRWLTAALVAATLGSLALSAWGVVAFRSATFYLLPTRTWELLLGALLARRILPAPGAGQAQAIAAAGLVAILVSVFAFVPGIPFPGPAALLPCLGAAAIIHAGQHGAKTMVGRLLATRPMVGIGLISYSLYLWHWPLLVMGRFYLDRPMTMVERIVVVLAAIGLAFVSWRYVERPFRRAKSAHEPIARPLLAGAATLAVLAAAGLLFVATRGLPSRVTPAVTEESYATEDANAPYNCMVKRDGRMVDRCGPERVAFVWGDSHAAHLYPALERIFGKGHVGRYGGPGCPPILGAMPLDLPRADSGVMAPADPGAGPRCRRINDAAIKAVLARKGVSLMVLSGGWPFYTEGMELNSPEEQVFLTTAPDAPRSIAGSRALFASGLGATVGALRGAGIPVLIMGDLPDATVSPSACLAKAGMLGRPTDRCPIQADAARRRLAYSNGVVSALGRQPGASSLLLSDILCGAGTCATRYEGALVYRNPDHLTTSASLALAPPIAAAIRPILKPAAGAGPAPEGPR